MTKITLKLETGFDREMIWEAGQSVRYLVSRIKAQKSKSGQKVLTKKPLNIALVIDASGSMSGGKLEAAKQASLGLVDRLSPHDKLTIVSFASDVIVHIEGKSVNNENLDQIRNEIIQLHTRNMTFFSGGWFKGVECASKVTEENSQLKSRVIVLSDGHANEGITSHEELFEHASELSLRGVSTSTLGIGDGYDEHLLSGIAENGGGRLHDAEFASEISSVLLGELDDIYDTVVENCKISIESPLTVWPEQIGSLNTRFVEGQMELDLGPLQNGIERTVVFKVNCPTIANGSTLKFNVSAGGKLISDYSTIKANSVSAILTATSADADRKQKRKNDLAQVVARKWSSFIAASAAKMNTDGSYEDAKLYVERELKQLKAYVKGLKGCRELVREIELLYNRVDRRFSPRTSKEIMLSHNFASSGHKDHRSLSKATWGERIQRGE